MLHLSIILLKPMSANANRTALLFYGQQISQKWRSQPPLRRQRNISDLFKIERSYYKTTCDKCRDCITAFFLSNRVFQPPPLSSKVHEYSHPIQAHYSFNYAQQVHFPSNPMQPGPIFFLTPRNCSIFVSQSRGRSIF